MTIMEEWETIESRLDALKVDLHCDCLGDTIGRDAHYANCKGLLKLIEEKNDK